MIGEFHFIRPYWLLVLFPVAVILVRAFRCQFDRGTWTVLCDEALLPFLLQQNGSAASRIPYSIGAVALALAIIAMAGPSWERLPTPVFRNASALVIALDLSPSMDAEDIKPSRLIRARYKIADLLKQRKDGQTALLVFAGEAYVVTPLTTDIATIDSQLSALTTDIMPNAGNNVEAAIAKAVALLKQAGLPQGQILLVSDGVDAITANKVSSTLEGHYTLAVLGIGTEQGAPIAAADGGFLKDRQGNILIPKLDTDGLAELADAGGGIYQTITASDADMQKLAAYTRQAIKQENQAGTNLTLDLWDDKGPWLLLAVLPLAALAFRKGILAVVLGTMAFLPDTSHALEWQDLWLRKDQRGQQAFQRHDFAKAATEFEDPEWKASSYYHAGNYQKALENFAVSKKTETSDHHYNQANALAKSGQLQEAIKAYDKALELNPENEDAKFNKELVEKALKQQEQQNQDRQQSQDNNKQQQSENIQPEQEDQKEQTKQDGKSGQDDNGAKPEPKPERPEPKQLNDGQQEQSNAGQQKQGEAEPKEENKVELENQQKPKENQKRAAESDVPLSDEQQQANEQWLKRIPDDPSGLLRRKFKYQYGQQKR